MKKIVTLIIIAGTLLFGTSLQAQDTLVVDPGMGTLNKAIKENGGNKIYKLQAGKWYGLDAIIEANDTTLGEDGSLVIVGEETDGMPAIVQVGNDLEGGVLYVLIRTFNDLTLKNLFIVDQDVSGTTGSSVLEIAAPAKVIIDHCVIDPAGEWLMIRGEKPADGSKMFMTNNLILRNGSMMGPNDPGFMGSNQWDTLYIENNTFVSSGQWLFGGAFHRDPPNNFIWINHNSFFYHDVWLGLPFNDLNYYMVNNLFHDVSIFSQLYAWGQFFPDYKHGNTMTCLANTDTLVSPDGTPETLPSTRVKFWQRNLQFNSSGVKSIAAFAKANDTLAPVYALPMLWDDNTPADYVSNGPLASPSDSSRENRIFNDDTNWPNMKFNYNMYDVDPGYTNDKIYALSDSAGANALSWFQKYIWGLPDIPEPADWPSYMWDVDGWAGTDPSYYPEVWPRFDGTYTNPTILTASIEGLPLGDLNWFPTAKASWLKHKDEVMQHILSLNEDQILLTGVKQARQSVAFTIYPNPAEDVLSVKSAEKMSKLNIYNIAGSLLKSVDMSSRLTSTINISELPTGLYMVKVYFSEGGVFSYRLVKK